MCGTPLKKLNGRTSRPDISRIARVTGWRPETGSGDRAMLVFEVPNVDARVAELKSRGVEIIAEPVDRPEWTVRTAHLRDPEGNLTASAFPALLNALAWWAIASGIAALRPWRARPVA